MVGMSGVGCLPAAGSIADVDADDRMRVWRPRVAGVAEVLHAQWRSHAYPPHTHDTWTVLLVDDGVIGYELDRRGHAAAPLAGITLLPPHVVHDGRPATSQGFRKRVLYLEADVFPESLIGSAVDGPMLQDDQLRHESSGLDRALVLGDDLEAESRLALVVERMTWHLTGRPDAGTAQSPAAVARHARAIFDGDPLAVNGIAAVAQAVGVTTAHLVRSFTRSYGIAPHRYLIGRRLDLARRRLLAGEAAIDVAIATGFYDQAHFTRHFRRLLAVPPGRYQRALH
jgi:AraC-like DNA-binding protein